MKSNMVKILGFALVKYPIAYIVVDKLDNLAKSQAFGDEVSACKITWCACSSYRLRELGDVDQMNPCGITISITIGSAFMFEAKAA